MIQDIWTITRKDLHEYAASLFTGPRSVLVSVLLVSLIAAFLSLQPDTLWLTQPITLLVLGWMPLLLVASMVADSFAGERDRHTLEPLLATRLSSCAILLGKIAAAALYGWGILLLCVLIAILTPAVTGSPLPYMSLTLAFWLAGISLLAAALAAAAGALLSIPAATARQAQQFVIIGMLALAALLALAPAAIERFLPVLWWSELTELLATSRMSDILAVTTLALVAVDSLLVALATSLLKRIRLSPN